MIRVQLGVEDLADTRFAISPLAETVFSLWALTDPSRHALHMPWVRAVRDRLDSQDERLLFALVGPTRYPADFRGHPSRALPDFVTPQPGKFSPRFEEELAIVRATAPGIVRRDLAAVHAPEPPPAILSRAADPLDAICDALERLWERALAPSWPQMRLVLEADTTYRARRLATGGARLLFADMHPNVSWSDGVLTVSEMVGEHTIVASGRGLLLVPSIFAYKPALPVDPGEPPSLVYPSRGIGTLWSPPPEPEPGAVVDLLGRTRAVLLQMLGEPLPTVEIARRLAVTPSAVSQHLRVLRAAGLLTRVRDGRQVLYRRAPLGDQLTTRSTVSASRSRSTASATATASSDGGK
jgi:DNA-binding transcriptional ArsR family regulator